MRKQSIYMPNNNFKPSLCELCSENFSYRQVHKKSASSKKTYKLFISAIELFINLLYEGSFYIVLKRKGWEAQIPSVRVSPQTDASARLETRNRFVYGEWHPCCLGATSANLSVFTWASLSTFNRSLSDQKFNEKLSCAGAHPSSWVHFHSKFAKANLAGSSPEGKQRHLFVSWEVKWNLSLLLWSKPEANMVHIRFQTNSPSVVTSLTSRKQVQLIWPENLARFPSYLWENNQCVPQILPANRQAWEICRMSKYYIALERHRLRQHKVGYLSKNHYTLIRPWLFLAPVVRYIIADFWNKRLTVVPYKTKHKKSK